MHEPAVIIVRVVPTTEHILCVFELSVTGRPDDAVADSVIGAGLKGCVFGPVNEIVCVAVLPADVVSWKDCITEPDTFVAVNVMLNTAAVAGVPCKAPPVNVIPDGNTPLCVIVGVGLPMAVGVNELLPPVVNVTLAGLVNIGALVRVSVKLALIGASVGTVVPPQVSSPASTATIDALLRLMAYVEFVALDCGERSNVASR